MKLDTHAGHTRHFRKQNFFLDRNFVVLLSVFIVCLLNWCFYHNSQYHGSPLDEKTTKIFIKTDILSSKTFRVRVVLSVNKSLVIIVYYVKLTLIIEGCHS